MDIITLGYAGIRAEERDGETVYLLRSFAVIGEYRTAEAAAHALVWRYVTDHMPAFPFTEADLLPEVGEIGGINGRTVRTRHNPNEPWRGITLTAVVDGEERRIGWCKDGDALITLAKGMAEYAQTGIPPATHPNLIASIVGWLWTARVFKAGRQYVVETTKDGALEHAVFDDAEQAFASLAHLAR